MDSTRVAASIAQVCLIIWVFHFGKSWFMDGVINHRAHIWFLIAVGAFFLNKYLNPK